MRSSRSKTVTEWPARASCCAAARPPGPEPTTATRRPVRVDATTGSTHPSLHARWMIPSSICLMVTASLLIVSTHAGSHGAGHSQPVNSGKLLVAWRASMAARQSSLATSSFHSGMRLPSGQPAWQNATPQSMQRTAWVRATSVAGGSSTTRQSRSRSDTGRLRKSTRGWRTKPQGLATISPHGGSVVTGPMNASRRWLANRSG